jgi:hypothetical protein
VYDDDPARRGPPTGAATQPTSLAPWPAMVPQPAAYLSLPTIVPKWGQLVNPAVCILFMGERRASTSSEPRLVIVYCQPQNLLGPRNQQFADDRQFIAMTLRPTTSQRDLEGAAYTSQTWRPAPRPPGDPRPAPFLRIFAGQPDPQDASRLMIPYELGGTRGVMVGRLQGDDTVPLVPDRPLTNGWVVDAARQL